MKTESITSGIVRLRNELQPKFNTNIDPVIFDYAFFTALESFVKKEREKSKEKMLAMSNTPEKEGIVLETPYQRVELKKSKASPVFDLPLFIDNVCKFYPDVMKHKLKELSTESVVEGTPRKTYTVTANDNA